MYNVKVANDLAVDATINKFFKKVKTRRQTAPACLASKENCIDKNSEFFVNCLKVK